MARRNQKRHKERTPRVAHEPSIDSVVTKIPRFAFEKFPQAGACARPPSLTTQMKSVGEAMAIGPRFKESLPPRLRAGMGRKAWLGFWRATDNNHISPHQPRRQRGEGRLVRKR